MLLPAHDEVDGNFGAAASTFILVLTASCLWWYRSRNSNFPPGPAGFPIVGYLPFLTKSVPQRIAELAEKYGPVYSLTLGRQRYVVLNSYRTIYEALVKQSSVFSGRKLPEIFREFGSNHGIIWRDYGETWRTLRKFGISTLKGFGVGKRSMEDRVNEETRYLLKVIQSRRGEAFDVQVILSNAVSNIICSIVTGQRYDYNDETFKKLLQLQCKRFGDEKIAQRINYMRSLPSLRYLPSFEKAFKSLSKQVSFTKQMFDDVIAEHQRTHDPNDIRDFIDAFLAEMNHNGEGYFKRESLDVVIRDFFNAGTETTTTLLRWCLLYLAIHPKVQERLRSEIILACGTDGPISMAHRHDMPATCSFIHEMNRSKPIVPLVVRKTSEGTEFKGFSIPKNTSILINIWQVHHDPKIFQQPHHFRPERFLDENGKFAKHDHVIPFSIGSRYCLGMHLAKMETFLFLTGVLRNFKVIEHRDHPLPSFEDCVAGLVYSPLHYKISFVMTS